MKLEYSRINLRVKTPAIRIPGLNEINPEAPPII